MNRLQQVLEEYNNWVELELQNARPLEGGYLSAVKSLLGIDWELGEVFFSPTALIVTDTDDYQGLRERVPGLKVEFRMECEYLNTNIYVLNFIEHKKLNTLLGGAS